MPSSRALISIPLALVLMLAPTPASAAPPEVGNLEFGSADDLFWDGVPGAAGYHLYRGDLSALAQGDEGACLGGSFSSPAAMAPEVPSLGEGYFFLTSAFDAMGEGSLGISVNGIPYVPQPACIPNRRAFALTEHVGLDGLPDAEPVLGGSEETIWQGYMESVSVMTHSGEVVVRGDDFGMAQGLRAKGIIVTRPGGGSTGHGRTVNWHYEEDDEDMLGGRAKGRVTPVNKPMNKMISDDDEDMLEWVGMRGLKGGPFSLLGKLNKGPSELKARRNQESDTLDVAKKTDKSESSRAKSAKYKVRDRESNPLNRFRDDPYAEDAQRYRSGILYDGPLGHGWDFPANAHISRVSQGTVLWNDGTGRVHIYQGGQSAVGLPKLLPQADGSFLLRYSDGTLDRYHGLDGSNIAGALLSRADDATSVATFLYDHQGLLATAVDSMGRATTYEYDDAGRITKSVDHAGPVVRDAVYSYDAMGNLVSVTSPPVTGTPNGNDFPFGKTTRYAYTSGFGDERLNHNLTSITAPREDASGGPALVEFVYGEDPTTFDYDRLGQATDGVAPPAGGVVFYTHVLLNQGADPSQINIPRRQMTVLDQNGNERRYFHSRTGHRILFEDRTNRELRPGEPDYITQYTYDAEGRLLQTIKPGGRRYDINWDTSGADHYRGVNVLEVRLSDSTSDPADVVAFTYEPMRNGPASFTDPLGRVTTWQYDYQEGDPLVTGLLTKAAQYGVNLGGIALAIGDVNNDGRQHQILGQILRIQEPTVILDPGSRQAIAEGDVDQERVKLRQYNDQGQLECETVISGDRDCFTYYPETDPDGDGTDTPPPPDGRTLDPVAGGYLASVSLGVDPVGGAASEMAYRYHADGTLAWARNGRGVSTVFIHNQLGQVVEVREAASTADSAGPHGDPSTGYGESGLTPLGIRTWLHYDANDNLVRVEREDVGQTRGVGATVDTDYDYDVLGRLVSVQQEEAPGETQTTGYDYDAVGNRIKRTSPAGRVDEYAYDERNLLMSSTRGVAGPFGGAPGTRQYEYDGNGRLTHSIDARGGLIDYEYDRAGRLVRTIDQTGSTSETTYDAVGNVTRVLVRGPVSGPTPPDRSGATNVDLSDTLFDYDEAGREVLVSTPVYVPLDIRLARPPVVLEGTLLPGDGAVNSRGEYDAAGRLTFATDDMGATTEYTYDSMNRLTSSTTPDGSSHVFIWDAASNLAEQEHNEASSVLPATKEYYLAVQRYDSLDNLTMSVDKAGRTHRFVWDSLRDLAARSDPRGPAGGSIIRRGQVVPINGHGNVTRYTYDAAGRMVKTEQVLTASGEGDGTLTPTPAPTPFNPDGLKHVLMTWGKDDDFTGSHDDAGNETLYQYDNLGRMVRRQADDGTATQYGYDPEGNDVSILDAVGSTLTQIFDLSGRRVRVDINRGPLVGGTTLQDYQYDGMGRLTRGTDNNFPANSADDSVMELFYDSLGRVVEEKKSLSDGTPTGVVDSHWLGENRRTTLVTVSDDQIHFGHDSLARVTSIADPAHGLSATYEYLGPNRLASRTLGNGVVTTMLNDAGTADIGYDESGRLKLMRHMSGGGSTGSALLAGFEYQYDAPGNRVSQRRLHQPGATGTAMGERYTHDSLGRMTLFQEGMLDPQHQPASPPTDMQSWSLDGNDNWAQFTRIGVPYQNTPNNLNEYDEPQSGGMRVDDGVPDDFGDSLMTPAADGANQAHDKNGGRTVDGTLRYQYDALGRLIRIGTAVAAAPPIATYSYDVAGRWDLRVITNAQTNEARRFYYDGPRVIEEHAGTAVLRAVAHPDDGDVIWEVRGDGSSMYLLHDGEGSAVGVVDGIMPVVLERTTYDAYGKPTFEDAAGTPILDVNGNFVAASPMGSREGFLGMRYYPESGQRTSDPGTDRGGLYCAFGDCYDPDQGRSLGGGGGVLGDTFDQARSTQMVRFFLKKSLGSTCGAKFHRLGEIWFDTYDTTESVHLGRVRLKRGRDLKHFRMVMGGLKATSFSVAAITTVQTRINGMYPGAAADTFGATDFRLGIVNPGPPHLSRQRVARLMGLVNERRGVW